MRVRSVLVPGVAAAIVAAMSVLTWRHHARAEIQARLDEFLAAREQRPKPLHVRTAVYGDTHDGAAMERYLVAQREYPGNDAATVAAIREGARSSHRGALQGLDEAVLDGVIERAAASAFAAGDVRLGAELYVDRCVFAIDTGNGTPAFPPMPDEQLRRLDRGSAEFLAAALERVDDRWPRSLSAESYLESWVRMGSQRGLLEQSPLQALTAWQHGFDHWTLELAWCEERIARLPKLLPPAEAWPDRQAQLAAFAIGCADPPRGFADRVPGLVRAGEEQARTGLAMLRFQRLALAFVHGHELPRLLDPLGKDPIDVDVRGGEATFRSEGMNGKQRLSRTVRAR